MKKIRFGIIGCGGISKKAFLPALQESESAEAAAVASRTWQKAEAFASEFDCKAIHGYSELLRREDIDAVYIATPISLHAEWAIAAANAGKHVLCEKSLTINLNEANKIVQACQMNNVALYEGFTYPFHPQHAKVKQLVEEGEIGKPVLFQGWFGFPPIPSPHRYSNELGGGALLDAGAYTVHSARMIFNREPINVHASFYNGEHKVEIQGSVLLDFGKGQTAQLAFGFDNSYRNSYSIWGTVGCITLARAYAVPPTFAPTLLLEKQNYRAEYAVNPYNQFLGEIDSFCSGLDDEKIRQKWFDDALNQMTALDRIRSGACS